MMYTSSTAQSSSRNYVQTKTYLDNAGTTFLRLIDYFDELGYVEQNANGTPTSWNYYVTDHLGSTRMVVGSDNSIKETINYYPFGSEMRMESPSLLTGGTSHPFRFTGKELDKVNSLNMYDFGARWYDVAGVPMWTSIDPLAEKYYNTSPYAYCANNPVINIDPDGRSTKVKLLEDGTYQIIGGDIDDDDRNIYLYSQDSNGEYTVKGDAIGVTTSSTSFYDSDNGKWRNSIINPSDLSGKIFLGKIFNNPNIVSYIDKARTNHEYDFKVTNGTPGKKDLDIYRGMPIGKTKEGMPIYTSARDIGNIAAGYVAAVNGLTWGLARLGFDTYQRGIEGVSTQNAQHYGWRYGRKAITFGEQIFNSSDPYIIP